MSLTRFIEAQEKDYKKALREIQNGKKESHWMWYIFPQLKDLGKSEISQYYGIKDVSEAKTYIQNPILRKNLLEISKVLLKLDETDIHHILGYPDDLKLCSCMTLFSIVEPDLEIFSQILDRYYQGIRDSLTIDLLKEKEAL